MSSATTQVFMDGDSQAVQIPAEFRLDTDRVGIFRTEDGDLVLHPLAPSRSAALMQALAAFRDVDDAFFDAVSAHRAELVPPAESQ